MTFDPGLPFHLIPAKEKADMTTSNHQTLAVQPYHLTSFAKTYVGKGY